MKQLCLREVCGIKQGSAQLLLLLRGEKVETVSCV